MPASLSDPLAAQKPRISSDFPCALASTVLQARQTKKPSNAARSKAQNDSFFLSQKFQSSRLHQTVGRNAGKLAFKAHFVL